MITALKGEIKPGAKVLLPRAKVAREILPEGLRAAGIEVNVVTAYETIADCADAEDLIQSLEAGKIDMVTFTSSSTVTNLVQLLGAKKELLTKVKTAVIGPITGATCAANGLTPAISAAEYTIDGLVTAIENSYKE